LTAFDLTLFHNFGANYPDALFLETLLAAWLKLAEARPELVLGSGRAFQLRRRALRQACLIRRHYEGHRVPDAPTSMGENARVLPEPFVRVPEEQILDKGKRQRELYSDKGTDEVIGPFGRRVLAQSLADLDDPIELRELGMAVFLDRPLGASLEPGEVDRTPLVSYEAFSRSIARRRTGELRAAGWIDDARRDALLLVLEKLTVSGLPVRELQLRERPGVVSIADAHKAAPDFVLLRSTRSSLLALLDDTDLTRLAPRAAGDWLTEDRDILLVQHDAGHPVLRCYRRGQFEFELALPLSNLD
jgi:hypothetical protein